jgi:esterase/lipase
MTIVFLLIAFALSVMIIVLLFTNMRVTQEVKILREQLQGLENGKNLLQDNLNAARRNLDSAESQMRSMRDELRAEIETGMREMSN